MDFGLLQTLTVQVRNQGGGRSKLTGERFCAQQPLAEGQLEWRRHSVLPGDQRETAAASVGWTAACARAASQCSPRPAVQKQVPFSSKLKLGSCAIE